METREGVGGKADLGVRDAEEIMSVVEEALALRRGGVGSLDIESAWSIILILHVDVEGRGALANIEGRSVWGVKVVDTNVEMPFVAHLAEKVQAEMAEIGGHPRGHEVDYLLGIALGRLELKEFDLCE